MTGSTDARSLSLARYDGAGNDFYIVDAATAAELEFDYSALARRICERKPGQLGADGLLVLSAPTKTDADVRMRIYNADGSIPEMCGNGARCAVIHWFRTRRSPQGAWPIGTRVRLDTDAGIILGELLTAVAPDLGVDPYVVRLDMGVPQTTWAAIGVRNTASDRATEEALELGSPDARLAYYGASLGNPHVVRFVDDVAAIDLERVGPAVEHDARFAHGANVHFVQVLTPHQLRVRHWERGSGATLACGTGAVACAVVAIARGLAQSPVRVDVPGGELAVRWTGGNAFLEGPVRVHAPEDFSVNVRSAA